MRVAIAKKYPYIIHTVEAVWLQLAGAEQGLRPLCLVWFLGGGCCMGTHPALVLSNGSESRARPREMHGDDDRSSGGRGVS